MAQTDPISKTKQLPNPIKVNIKSDINAPRGPPRLLITSLEFLLKNPESVASYETSEINIQSENAIRKKLKKFKRVFLMYGGINL